MCFSPKRSLHCIHTGLCVILASIPLMADELPAPSPAIGSSIHTIPEEAMQFLQGIVLLLLPERFEDDDDWGTTTKVQSGLDVDWDDGRMETRRRWKAVNHGSWKHASGELCDPAETFQLRAARLTDTTDGAHQYDVRLSTRLRVTGRQQQWSYGLRLWSVSADAEADVSLHVIVAVKSELINADSGTRLRLVPTVTHAAANLDSFNLRRVSHAKGSAVREFGSWLERLIQQRVDQENTDLADRINKALQRKPEQLEIPFDIGGWLLSK